jgi:hypothetical protein
MRDFKKDSRGAGTDKTRTNYNSDINTAERSSNNQLRDTIPGQQIEGYLGIDDIDRLRRRKISKIF